MANGPLPNDPWARREAWRYNAFFSRASNARHMFPGLGIATVAFTIYCGAEYLLTKNSDKH
ncbi:hypothetical protein K493DRAFT_309818 [Basidiobolus meristosporus CBS 931.73]|uniref:NADH-ubiquinone oxidoreductase B12 subunit n=1 Tax=Basidiobolus meristosporus CBS 931.73 TaxID=1314790 RepID=A0A1Y1ZDS9_9FUNG|nr:hypothetical protein K493DRAFT_309818 [Basidiobolus meristosporus CBS 931.73]|eukprot:ORY08398.1 hypothetical protein K493DRAFT_309818 [Basidiobolus meristosporus CBS 931.73]